MSLPFQLGVINLKDFSQVFMTGDTYIPSGLLMLYLDLSVSPYLPPRRQNLSLFKKSFPEIPEDWDKKCYMSKNKEEAASL